MSAAELARVVPDVDEGPDSAIVRAAWSCEGKAASRLGLPWEDPAASGQRDGAAALALRESARRQPEATGAAALLAVADRQLWMLVCRYGTRIESQARRSARRARTDLDDTRAEVRLLWWRAALSWHPAGAACFATFGYGWARRACRGLSAAREIPGVVIESEPAEGASLVDRLDLAAALATCPMTDRERAVLDAVFGLAGGEPLHVQEAADALGLGRGTVRVTRDAVVKRLRRRLGAPVITPPGPVSA